MRGDLLDVDAQLRAECPPGSWVYYFGPGWPRFGRVARWQDRSGVVIEVLRRGAWSEELHPALWIEPAGEGMDDAKLAELLLAGGVEVAEMALWLGHHPT